MKNRLITLSLAMSATLFTLSARTISGTVLSDADSTAVIGATCSLIADQKTLTATQTGADGAFTLSADVKSALTLSITQAGYNPTAIIIESGSGNIDLGTVYLNQGTTLDEVTVTADAVIHSKGRTIVYPSQTDVKASSTALSLFQKLPLPGLQANPIQRSLSVDGGTPVILINGVPATMDEVNALQPKDILKVEYSRATPARYTDRGGSGFVNITLKKRDDGGQVYLWGRSAVATGFVNANLSASYHQGPSEFTLAYVPEWRNYRDVYDNSSSSYIGDDFRVNLEEHDRNPFNYQYHNIRLKYNFLPNPQTLFSATFSASPSSRKSRVIGHTEDSQLGVYDNNNLSKSNGFSPSLDLFFRRDFNDKNSLEVEVVGTLSNGKYRRDNSYFYSDGSEQSYIMDVDSRRRSLITEVSYIHQFSDAASLSAGYQNTVSHSRNKYITTDYEPVLTENNNYIYARYGQQIGRVYLSLSTGAKLFWIENDLNRRHFIRNLTTARVSWNINNSWSVSALFRYTPSIPSLSELTDYEQQVSPYLISNGNPDLKVADQFLYNLSASYQYRKFAVSLYSAVLNAKNSVISDMVYLGDDKFLTQSVNARHHRVYQTDLYFQLKDIYGFGARFNVSYCHYQNAGADWSHHLNTVDAALTVWWNKGPVTISYWRKFPGKYLAGHTVGKDENGDALSVEYRPTPRWTIGLDWMYMFERKGSKYPTWSYSPVNPSVSERYIKNNGNMIVLSVSYSADFGTLFRAGRRSLNNRDTSSPLLEL